MNTPERSVSAEVAIDRVRVEIARLGLRASEDRIGGPPHPVPVARLYRDGEPVATGYGKGVGPQGTASALFEAFEVYLMSWRGSRRYTDGTALLSAADVAAQPALAADLVVRRWAADFPDGVAACARYTGAAGQLWYPVFLTDPAYHRAPLPGDSIVDYQSLLRYSSSLGTAAGATAAEATLHALGELVEHDGVSHALLRWFVRGEAALDHVAPADLPPDLRCLYEEAAAGTGVLLVDVTTDIGVPTYLAIRDGDGTAPAVFGAGASLFGRYAAERALSELIQVSAGTQDAGTSAALLRRLAPWPALRDCLCLPVRRLLGGRVRRVGLRPDLATDPADVVSLAHQLTVLLGRHGVGCYRAELTPTEWGAAVVTAVAPGLERFSLVHYGVPIAPTGRGSGLWPTAASSVTSA